MHLYSDRTRQAAERLPPNDEAAGKAERLGLPSTEWIWARMDEDLGPAPSVLFIGGGGYTLPTQLLSSRPDAAAIAVEIDPLITEVVQRHLPWAGEMIESVGYDASGLQPLAGRLGIVHEDGRVYLNETDLRFDAAVVDAFSSASVPAHLATLETFENVQRIVDGPVYVNLIDRPDGPLARGVHAILSSLYTHVLSVHGPLSDRGTGNVLIAVVPTSGFLGYAAC